MATKGRKRIRESAEMRREQIVDEAIRLIGQRGYYGFTIQDVAQACGLSNAGLLHYFPSKDHLLVAVIEASDRRESEIVRSLAEFATAATRNGSTALAARHLLRTIVARGAAQPEMIRLHAVLQAEAFDSSHPAHKALRAREASILRLLSDIARPYVAQPGATARHLFALMDGLGQQWLRSGRSFDLVGEYAKALDALIPALRAPKPAAKRKAKSRKTAS